MLVSIQDLRSIQERCDVGELVQRIDVSIDRLTVIWDTDTGSLRRIFKNLKQAISTRVDAFEIHDIALIQRMISFIRQENYLSHEAIHFIIANV